MAESIIKRNMIKGNWTPHFYDYETDLGAINMDSSTSWCEYYDYGKVFILSMYVLLKSSYTFNNMFQIRNLPFSGAWVLGGTIYANVGSTNTLGNTIQASNVGLYCRPNWTGTLPVNSRLSACLICVRNAG